MAKDKEPRLTDTARRELESRRVDLLKQRREREQDIRAIAADAGGDSYHDNVFLEAQSQQMAVERLLAEAQAMLGFQGSFEGPNSVESVQLGHRVRISLVTEDGSEELDVLLLDGVNAGILRGSPQFSGRGVEVISEESDLGRAILNSTSGSEVRFGRNRSARILGIYREKL